MPLEEGTRVGLNAAQMRNARIIYNVGIQMGMSNRDIQIALITAMQESSLLNLKYGDRDSLGLFQQRPSQGWGTPEQVTDPEYAARKFFSTLRGVKNRQTMSMTAAAQAVQRSAYPNAYAKHIPLIRSVYPNLGTGAQQNPSRSFRSFGEAPDPASPADVYSEMYDDEYGYVPDDSTTGMAVLGTNYNPALSASGFWPDSGAGTPDWASDLNQGTFDYLRDQAASRGQFIPERGTDNWRSAIVSIAKDLRGVPYVWGGTSPNGFDCSGFVQYVYGKLGIQLPRVSYQQANAGTHVSMMDLKPGDLVAWDNSPRNNGADHIAIYIGNGRIIEAARPGTSVRIRKLGQYEGAWGVRINRK